ncbi:RagB/SusD family nutrient uptake outer membrane protein [Carboxylicivirga sediminis]|uniref:RagB/SusD family nutrient uptake outer membrane protein n=1 Tax=Carboxylicivirga sediminis TaxID=2006564 RepID=A0A941F2C3_9BACT|nr:RagB/SusD family nutrient uptake outer membrane protein [Carboxylicivirga sediminis]MBR8534475.1 RagB/SusD family nutrient uptake outer membrane protein [Carboxylicivirga sediminis]
MKTQKYNITSLFLILLMVLASGCSDYFEPEIDKNRTEEQIWSIPDYAEGILMAAYKEIPDMYNTYGGDFLDCATDNATSNRYGASVDKLRAGGWSSNYNPLDVWGAAFNQIRNINLFIENGLDITYVDYNKEIDSAKKARLKGEAYFLRAWYQWQLLQNHAGPNEQGTVLGYPILTRVYTQDEEVKLARNTYAECVQQILNDCDTAAAYLPLEYLKGDEIPEEINDNQIGRATATAALALKSRAALYAASPLFANNETDKWATAAQLAKATIDVIGALPSIDEKFYNDENSPELIMRKYALNRALESSNFPVVLFGQGRTNPSQNLVDAFPMANGYPISDDLNSGYDESMPYEGRDPRFYRTILFHGALFKDSTIDMSTTGLNSELASPERASRTGYFLRKWMSPDVNLEVGNAKSDNHYFALFRKVELYLNYAEAANEAWGPEADPLGLGLTAKDAINAVRSRAGIGSTAYADNVASDGADAFRSLVHNERRIELCFESHRFYDLRRWNSSLEQLNTTIKGVKVERIVSDVDTTFQLTPIDVENYQYGQHMFYGPIPFSEVIKSGEIVQNKGW